MLSGSERLLSGTVTDDRISRRGRDLCPGRWRAGSTILRGLPVIPSGQLTGDWSVEVPIPNTVDGEIYTLTFTGIDSAGNRSTTAVTHIVTADFVGPTIQITTQPAFAIHYSTVTALAGTIADNSGVAGLKLQINLPDNGDVIRDEFEEVDLGSGPNWSHSMTFDRQGDYAFGVVGTDTYGNQTQLGAFKVTSVNAGFNVPPTADTGGPYEVNEGETVTFGGLADDINAGQNLSVAWDMDGNGTFETPDILNPLFDATNIDGPDRRDIALRVSDGAFTTTVNSEVVIRNLPPSSDSGGPYEVNEGDLLTLNGSGTDPYYGDTVSYSWDLDEDDIFGDALGATAVFSATLIDGPEVISVTLKVTDDDDDFTTHTTAVTVTNVVPQLANLNALAITENSVATLNGTIVEPSVLDTLDMEVVWGDGRGSTATFATTTASAAGIPPVPGSPGGNQIVHLEADAFYEAGIQHRFENGTLNGWVSQDWSSYDGLTFWVYGTGSDTTLFFDLFDNRNPGSIIDDAERWRYEFDDPAPGWQQISAPFSQFEHLRTETSAPVDGLGLTEVWGWAFGFITSDGLETRFIDDVTLFNSTVTAASGDFERESQDARFAAPLSTNATSVVDDFENGLPSGSDSNGVAVGFSVHRDIVGGTFYYSYDAGTTNFSEGHLYIDDDDDDSFPVTLRIRDDDDETFSTFDTTIEVGNVAPVVNFSPTSQTIQYSDGIGTIDIVGTDVISDPLTIDTSWKFNNGSPTAGLMPGLSLTDDGCMGNGDYTQDCTWKVLGVADVPVGDYVITAVIEDDDGGLTTIDVPITVIHEDATALLSEYNPSAVPVADPGSGTLSEPFTLIATIEESEPDLAPYLAYAGDINLALVTITLDPIDGGGPLTQSCTPQPVNPVTGYDDILTVSCDFDAVPLNIYTILLNVEGEYYQGGDDYSLVIYDPAGGYQLGAHAAALRNCAVTDFDLLHLHNYSEADCDIFSAGLSELGQNASLDGDILSFGDIIVRRDGVVSGDAVAAGTVQLLGGGVVNGAVVEGATVYQPLLPWAHTRFKAGTFFGDVTVAANGTRDLDPGSYHDLVLGQAAVLNLSSGNYRFNSMLGNFESEIYFDLTEGPVIIYVAGDAIFETEVKMFSNGSPREILFHVAGSQVKLGQTGTYLGTYVAPEAYIDLRDEATLTGALYGDTIDARPNSIINGLPAARLYTNLYVKPFYLTAQQQQLSLNSGWNMISSPIDPLFPALEFIFAAPQGDNLVLCKDGLGRVYWPAFGLNQIGDWNVLNGYKCYTSAAVAPTIVGEPVVPGDTPVDLAAGWSIMAYLRSTPMAVQTALLTIDGQVVLVKNGSGEVYWPNFGVNQIGNMVPGEGYEIYMGGPDQLIYPDN